MIHTSKKKIKQLHVSISQCNASQKRSALSKFSSLSMNIQPIRIPMTHEKLGEGGVTPSDQLIHPDDTCQSAITPG